MKTKLPFIDRKSFEILRICQSNKLTTIGELSMKLKVTERSVRSYIKELNESLDAAVQLINIKGQGYKLVVKDASLLEALIEQHQVKRPDFNVKEERINYLLLYLLSLEGYATLDTMAEELHVSRTTLVNDFKVIKEHLADYGLILDNKQNRGMSLVGSEVDKRLLLFNYLKKTGGTVNRSELYQHHQETLTQGLITIFEKHNCKITDRLIREIHYHMLVMVNRLDEGKHLSELDHKIEFLKTYVEYNDLTNEIKELLEMTLAIKLDDLESTYLVIPLISGHAPFQDFQLSELNEEMLGLVDQVWREIENETGISVKDDELKKGLGYHLKFALNRFLLNIIVKNNHLDEIKNKFRLAFKLAQVTADVITKKYQLNISEDEIGYMALHFETYLEKHKNKLVGVQKIALICENALGISRFINTKLRRVVNEEVAIDTFSYLDIRHIDLDEYDIVLNTTELDIQLQTTLIKIDPIFDEDTLRKELNSALSLKRGSAIPYHHFEAVVNCMPDDAFFMPLNEKTVLKSLAVMLARLQDLGHADHVFKERVMKRESEASTAIDNGILLPHAVNDDSTELTVAIGVMRNQVTINDIDIKLIILMIFPPDYEDSDLVIKVYEDILKIGHQKKLIDEIVKCETLIDFKNI